MFVFLLRLIFRFHKFFNFLSFIWFPFACIYSEVKLTYLCSKPKICIAPQRKCTKQWKQSSAIKQLSETLFLIIKMRTSQMFSSDEESLRDEMCLLLIWDGSLVVLQTFVFIHLVASYAPMCIVFMIIYMQYMAAILLLWDLSALCVMDHFSSIISHSLLNLFSALCFIGTIDIHILHAFRCDNSYRLS